MPTPPGFADIAIQITHIGLSRPAYLTFGIDPTATDPQNIASSIAETLNEALSIKTLIDQECVFSEVRVSLGTDGTEDLVGGLTTNVACTLGGTALPPNCALLVHKRTARGGRRGRGRLFIPWGAGETAVDEAGIISASHMGIATSALEFWRTSLASAQCPMVLLHQPSAPGTEHPTAPGAPNVVTALTPDKLISTQRRRLGRR